jgi:hypothetical protein
MAVDSLDAMRRIVGDTTEVIALRKRPTLPREDTSKGAVQPAELLATSIGRQPQGERAQDAPARQVFLVAWRCINNRHQTELTHNLNRLIERYPSRVVIRFDA